MKKVFAIMLTLLMVALVFAACVTNDSTETESATVAETERETEAATETEAIVTEEIIVTEAETEAPKGGCSSVLGFSAAALLCAMAAAVALKKE